MKYHVELKKILSLKSTIRTILWLWGWGLILILDCSLAFGENIIQDINFLAKPGNKVELRFVMAKPVAIPKNFFIDTTSKLVLDFFATTSALASKKVTIGVGSVHDISIVTQDNRTRIVVKFDKKIPYELQVRKNTLLLTVDSDLARATRKTKPEPAPVAPQEVAPQEVVVDPQPEQIKESGVQSIDFHRGPNGEGKVLIAFDQPNTVVNLKEEGRNIVIEIMNTRLRPDLRQKLDVTDFATPVQSIISDIQGNNVRIKVQATGSYEYVAYQVDRLYTLDFVPKTPEEEEKAKRKQISYVGKKLTLNFQDIPVRTILHLFGEFTGLNMVISDTVTGNVTLRLKNVPWDQALDIILKTKFLGKREKDSVIYVAPLAELMKEEQAVLESEMKAEELAPLQMEIIELKYAKALDIKTFLDSSSKSKATKTSSDRSVTSGDARAANKANATTDINTSNAGLLSERGSVAVYEQTNNLLIRDTAVNIENIRAIIAKIDVPVQQVMIEGRVVVADNNFARNLGVRFGVGASREINSNSFAYLSGSQPGYLDGTNDYSGSGYSIGAGEPTMVNLPVSANSGINLLIGKFGEYLMQLELTALQQEGQGEIISSPRVIAMNGLEATIEQGVEIGYSEYSEEGISAAFKKAVLSLKVTPRITIDSRINMDLIVNKDSVGTLYLGIPSVNTQSVKTTVLVNNGETIVLGGIYERGKGNSRGSVPFFGGIPILGHLFRNSTESNTNSELLFFITPKILRADTVSTTP